MSVMGADGGTTGYIAKSSEGLGGPAWGQFKSGGATTCRRQLVLARARKGNRKLPGCELSVGEYKRVASG